MLTKKRSCLAAGSSDLLFTTFLIKKNACRVSSTQLQLLGHDPRGGMRAWVCVTSLPVTIIQSDCNPATTHLEARGFGGFNQPPLSASKEGQRWAWISTPKTSAHARESPISGQISPVRSTESSGPAGLFRMCSLSPLHSVNARDRKLILSGLEHIFLCVAGTHTVAVGPADLIQQASWC